MLEASGATLNPLTKERSLTMKQNIKQKSATRKVALQPLPALPTPEAQAAAVNAFLESDKTPTFIFDAIIDAIDKAHTMTGAPAPCPVEDVNNKAQVASYKRDLAYLIDVMGDRTLRGWWNASNPILQLAEHISAVLKHPDTPVRLYNEIAEEVCDMSSRVDSERAQHIAEALEAEIRHTQAQAEK